MDVLTSDDPQVGEELERSAERAALRGAVGRLSPRSRIMELRFGLNHETEHTQKEVADTLGISQSYISRLESASSAVCAGSWRRWDKNLQPRRGRACPTRGLPVSRNPRKAADRTCAASTGRCLLHHRLRPGIRHKLHRQPGDHVHLGLQRVQQVLVPSRVHDIPVMRPAFWRWVTVTPSMSYCCTSSNAKSKSRRGKASARSWPCAGSCGGPAQCRSRSPRPAPQ